MDGTATDKLNQASFLCQLHAFRFTRELPKACPLRSDGWLAELQRRKDRAWSMMGSPEPADTAEARRELVELEVCWGCVFKARAHPVIRAILAQQEEACCVG